jgi:hypothetical protein
MRRWDNFKLQLEEMGYEDVNWPYLVNTIVVGPAATVSRLCNIQV